MVWFRSFSTFWARPKLYLEDLSVQPAQRGRGLGKAMLAELANRLPTGGAALVDLQAPELPERVDPYVFTAEAVGEIAYRGIAEAWPLGGEAMRWRMTYLSLDGERVLTEDTVEHVYHHPSPAAFAAECAAVGLRAGRLHAPFLLLEMA